MQILKIKILENSLNIQNGGPMSAMLNPSNNNNFVISWPILIKLVSIFTVC